MSPRRPATRIRGGEGSVKSRTRMCLQAAGVRGGSLSTLRFCLPVSLLAVILVMLASFAAPALAVRGHVFDRSFGKEGSGAGELKEPSGVAVDEATGDVYVVDKGNDRVQWFNSTGTKVEGELNGSGLLMSEGFKEAGGGGLPGEILTGQFDKPEGIAVDNSCFLHKTPAEETTCKESDPSAGDVYVVDTGHSVIDKFTATGEYVGQLSEASAGVPFGDLDGVAVDSKGEVWTYEHSLTVSSFNTQLVNEFVSVQTPQEITIAVETLGYGVSGFAVDGQDDLYVNGEYEPNGVTRHFIVKLGSESHALNNTVDAEESTAVATELSSNDVYVDNVATVGRFGPEGELLERLSVPGLHGSGVGVNSSAEEVYVADSATDAVIVFTGELPSKPTVEASTETVSDVTATSATLEAQVNARDAATTARFEYGPCATPTTCASSGYEQSTPSVSAGSEFAAVKVGPVHVQGLSPGTVYHFRALATNSNGAGEGERDEAGEEVVRTFTTQTVGAFVLPDGRQWELVSPPDKHGALLEPIGDGLGVPEAAANGDAIAYTASAPTESEPQGYSYTAQVLSSRGAGGWQSRDLGVAHGSRRLLARVGRSIGSSPKICRLVSCSRLGASSRCRRKPPNRRRTCTRTT